MRQDMTGFMDGSGISWTICKQSASRSRHIITPSWLSIRKSIRPVKVERFHRVIQQQQQHMFNGPFSGTTQVSQYQKNKNQSGFHWSKRQWVAVASAGPYASLHLAPDRQPRQHPTTQFFTGQMPFLPPKKQHQSAKNNSIVVMAYHDVDFLCCDVH